MLIIFKRSITQSSDKNYSEELISLDLEHNTKILKVKQLLEEITQIDTCHQMLFYRGRILEDKEQLNFYNFEEGHHVAILRRSIICTCHPK